MTALNPTLDRPPQIAWRVPSAKSGDHPGKESVDELLARAQTGDQRAFEALYERHATAIFRFFRRRTGDPDVAADLTLDVFMQAWRTLERGYSWHVSFNAWLYRVARNRLVDYIRVVQRQRETELAVSLPDPSADGVDDKLEREFVTREVRLALDELKPEYAEVLRLRYEGELSHAETGRLLGKSEEAIKVTHHRALKALRLRLSRRPALQQRFAAL